MQKKLDRIGIQNEPIDTPASCVIIVLTVKGLTVSKVKDLFEHLQSWIFSCNSPEVDEFLDFDDGAPNNQPDIDVPYTPVLNAPVTVEDNYSCTKDASFEPCPICKGSPDIVRSFDTWFAKCAKGSINKHHEVFIKGISKKSIRLKWNNFVRKVERDLQWA